MLKNKEPFKSALKPKEGKTFEIFVIADVKIGGLNSFYFYENDADGIYGALTYFLDMVLNEDPAIKYLSINDEFVLYNEYNKKYDFDALISVLNSRSNLELTSRVTSFIVNHPAVKNGGVHTVKKNKHSKYCFQCIPHAPKLQKSIEAKVKSLQNPEDDENGFFGVHGVKLYKVEERKGFLNKLFGQSKIKCVFDPTFFEA